MVGVGGAMFGGSGGGGMGPVEEEVELPEHWEAANETETAEFGAQLQSAFETERPEMDLRRIVSSSQVALRGLPEDAQGAAAAAFIEQVANALGREPGFLEEMHATAQRGHLTYRGVFQRDGNAVARYRFLGDESGASFFDVLFASRHGRARVLDYFTLAAGRWQSEIYGEVFEVSVNALFDQETYNGMVLAFRQERYADVLAMYDALPRTSQGTVSAASLRVEAAAALRDPETTVRVLDEYVARFPDDPSAHLRLLGIHLGREELDEADAAVDELAAAFPDPFWDSPRAEIALKRQDYAPALVLAERIMDADETLKDGPQFALAAALGLGDLERANTVALRLRDGFEVDLTSLVGRPGYERITELPALSASTEAAQ